jgi:hypothetical protein
MAYRTLIASFIVNLYLNLAFYPSLLKYQSGSEAAMWINQNNPGNLPVVQLHENNSHPMDFYIGQPITTIYPDKPVKLPSTPFLFYGNAEGIKTLTDKGLTAQPVAQFQHYWVSRLKPQFLNHTTRAQLLDTMQVVIIK